MTVADQTRALVSPTLVALSADEGACADVGAGAGDDASPAA